MSIELVLVGEPLKDVAVNLIKEFWVRHNDYTQELEETLEDYQSWTRPGHLLYLVKFGDAYIGFAHLGSRGAEIDWLEDFLSRQNFKERVLEVKLLKKLKIM